MTPTSRNPFDITKASHLTDDQINSYWVDLPGGGHMEIGNPTLPTPMLIRGGKGSGKTHLMRYYSFALQKLRAGTKSVTQTVRDEGYLGIYFKCSGLNAGRFAGKGCSTDVWRSVFSYYCELWLAEHALQVLTELIQTEEAFAQDTERLLVADTIGCFDCVPDEPIGTFAKLNAFLAHQRRAIDLAVNNAPLAEKLDVTVYLTPGKLVFGLPDIFWRHFPAWKQTLVVYLIDEFENFSTEQQRYINTLIRETAPPCTFKIGGRHYGFKTYKTFSDEEENKEGSEFESLSLDSTLRDEKPEYRAFAARLCLRRLAQHGYSVPADDGASALEYLRQSFEAPTEDFGLRSISEEGRGEAEYIKKLRQQLTDGISLECAPGLQTESEVETIIDLLRVPGKPLLEKVNILSLYQKWANNAPVPEAAKWIHEECARLSDFPEIATSSEYTETLKHYKGDLLAQLRRDTGRPQGQAYVGIDCFVEMSEGLPRNLLIILKHVLKWAIFYGEQPFTGTRISEKAQVAGVREAAEWFLNDARSPGADGHAVRTGVSRLARLFKEIRFSDKPSECSLCAFSADYDACGPNVQRIVDLAEQWSLLIRIASGQKDRNKRRVDRKFQLNGMLSPYWDLPVSRRGVIHIPASQLAIIFTGQMADEVEDIVKTRISAMRAPCFGKKRKVRRTRGFRDDTKQTSFLKD